MKDIANYILHFKEGYNYMYCEEYPRHYFHYGNVENRIVFNISVSPCELLFKLYPRRASNYYEGTTEHFSMHRRYKYESGKEKRIIIGKIQLALSTDEIRVTCANYS